MLPSTLRVTVVSITNIWGRVSLVVIVVIDHGYGSLIVDDGVEDHCSDPYQQN